MFDWEALLAVAERLLFAGGDEASQRTAINRAYYAAYHVAATHVRTTGLLRARHTHTRVWAVLADDTNSIRADVGQRGDVLRRARVDADYRSTFPGSVDERARESVADARAIIETLRRLG